MKETPGNIYSMFIMKKLFLAIFLITTLCAGCSSDSEDNNEKPQDELQITLYDENKEAIAYIDNSDSATIYLFEGDVVAYIESEEQVYGFNGRLLGWYSDGVLYDQTYHAVGAKHGIARGGINTVATYPERRKGIKQVKPVKPVKGNDFAHPVLIDSWSETTLIDFFAAGKK